MAGTPIGRILLMPKGNYSGTAVYNSLDWVRYNGSAWVCTADNTTGIAPAIGVPEWQVLAQDGTVSGTVDWSNVNFKPFDTVGSGLDVDVSNTLKLDMSLLTGSNISYDNSGSGAASNNVQDALDELFRGGGGGGLLPYFFIDSEAGSTVTVSVPDGSTITPTAAGSGHWECSVPMYGTYTIHSVLAGQGDATVSVNVDDVKQYHITDNHYDHTISFVAPSGSTVRIEGGTEIYTLTGTGSTQTQAVHSASTSFTVTATMDGNGKPYTFTTPSTTGQTTTIPSGTFDFGTINVSVAADFVTAGSTITCAKTSISTISKTAASTLTFRVPDIGEYTISGSVGGQTYSTTATVTALGTPVSTSLQTLPEGSTVLPTDDIPTWLACGGLSSTGYTTLSQVLADSTTLLALMSDNNAVDYLVRSKTWISDICGDSTAMTDIGANNYCANTLLADSDWVNGIANSTYRTSVLNVEVPTMTSDTAPSGYEAFSSTLEQSSAYYAFNTTTTNGSVNARGATPPIYVGIKFPTTKRIYATLLTLESMGNTNDLSAVQTELQYSTDGNIWSTFKQYSVAITNNSKDDYLILGDSGNKYQYYRFNSDKLLYTGNANSRNKSIRLQFYGREDV